MKEPNLRYTINALWYAAITVAWCPPATRVGLGLWTPHDGLCLFPLGGYRRSAERASIAAQFLAQMFEHTPWYNRPRQVRCREPDLRKALEESIGSLVEVRSDTSAPRFRELDAEFRACVLTPR